LADWASLVFDPAAWIALATLMAMEVVLGVDNLIFLALITNRVAEARRGLVRKLGLGIALLFRLLLLVTLASVVKLTQPIVTILEHEFSWRDGVLIAGGLFLVWKATREIHDNVEAKHDHATNPQAPALNLFPAVVQLIALDLVFSIDSIITAVGMTDKIPIMVVAIVFAMFLMLVAAGHLSRFIDKNPTLLMLVLSFLLMIGMVLIADGFGFHVPRGYVYAAILFSVAVEGLNMLRRRNQPPPQL
jgi:predicted tellurium resistance membrane protein TerC